MNGPSSEWLKKIEREQELEKVQEILSSTNTTGHANKSSQLPLAQPNTNKMVAEAVVRTEVKHARNTIRIYLGHIC